MAGTGHAVSVSAAGGAGNLHNDPHGEPECDRIRLRSYSDCWIIPGTSGSPTGRKPQAAADRCHCVPQLRDRQLFPLPVNRWCLYSVKHGHATTESRQMPALHQRQQLPLRELLHLSVVLDSSGVLQHDGTQRDVLLLRFVRLRQRRLPQ